MSVLTVSALIINPSDYTLVKQIGTGCFGSVYLAQDKRSGKYAALKKIQCQMMSTIQQQYLIREIEIMGKAKHPALLPMIGYSMPMGKDGENQATIVMEYMSNGSLFQVLQLVRNKKPPAQWNATTKNIMLLGIAAGMQFLHRKNIIHRDLKPENILLDENFEPHIGDFGLSKIINIGENKNNTTSIGTPLYMAPEIFANAPYDFRVDVYAFGMLAYEILTEINPFSDVKNPMALGMKICNGERPPFPPNLSPLFVNLIDKCWAHYAVHRPIFDEIVEYLSHKDVFVEGADLNLLNEYKNKVLSFAQETGKPIPASPIEKLELQIQKQNTDIQVIQKSFADAVKLHNKNTEKSRNDLLSLKNDYTNFQNEMKNMMMTFSDLIQQITLEQQKLGNELKSIAASFNQSSPMQSPPQPPLTHYASLPVKATVSSPSANNPSLDPSTKQLSLTGNIFTEKQGQDTPTIQPPVPAITSDLQTNSSSNAQITSDTNKVQSPRTESTLLESTTRPRNFSLNVRKILPIFSQIFCQSTDQNYINTIISVSGSSLTMNDTLNLINVFKPNWSGDWNSSQGDDNYIQIKFKKNIVTLQSYQLKTYSGEVNGRHLKSWLIEGSNDGLNWVIIDSQQNNEILNGSRMIYVHKFTTSQPPYRFIRLKQNGPSFAGPNQGFAISNIEFYGKML